MRVDEIFGGLLPSVVYFSRVVVQLLLKADRIVV
jgi:hypothetical protein